MYLSELISIKQFYSKITSLVQPLANDYHKVASSSKPWRVSSMHWLVAPLLLLTLTAVSFETGAMPVPTKSQNPTICG